MNYDKVPVDKNASPEARQLLEYLVVPRRILSEAIFI